MIRRHGWDVAAWAAIVFTLVVDARFSYYDHRPPTDLGHYYSIFQLFVQQWQNEGHFDIRLIDTPYSLLLAGLAIATHPSVELIERVDGTWLFILLGGAWLAARSIAGPRAGALTAFLVSTFPQTAILCRTHWIHHPEAAAIVGALGLWLWKPEVPRWWHAFAIATLVFFGETIRPTGIPFGLPVALLILGVAWRRGTRAKLVPILLTTLAGVAWYAPSIGTYVSRKSADAGQYAMSVHHPFEAFIEGMGRPLFVVSIPLVLLSLLALRRRDAAAGAMLVCLAWIAGGVVAVGYFNVGGDNFPLAGIAAGILAGIGAAQIPALGFVPVGAAATLLVGILGVGLESTTLISENVVRPIQRYIVPWGSSGPLNYMRVYWNPIKTTDVIPLVTRACGVDKKDKGRCQIVASRGLFNPSWEDGGTFALFLAGVRGVNIMTPQAFWDPGGNLIMDKAIVKAVVDVECARNVAPDTGGRFGLQSEKMRELMWRAGTEKPDAVIGDQRACMQSWYLIPSGVQLERR